MDKSQRVNEIKGADTVHPNLLRIKTLLAPQREKLLNHPIYEHIKTPIHVRKFMTQHVFAVWDFMSLLKSLQHRFCGCEVPWRPEKKYPLAVRLINEIVLAEESDVGPTGQFLSHYEMYRMAMVQAGASTKEIDMLILDVEANKDLNEILDSRKFPSHICSFLRNTFESIHQSNLEELAAIFLFGREDLIPDLFRGLINQLNQDQSNGYELFEYYLQRHIEIDDEQHGPMGEELLCLLCGVDERKWEAAGRAAKSTLESRHQLWDGILESLAAV